MTDEYLEQKFKELIYHFGEINWSIIDKDAWQKFINKDEKFNEQQLKDLRFFVKDLIDELTDKPE